MQASQALNETRLPQQVLRRFNTAVAASESKAVPPVENPAEVTTADPAPETDPRESDPAYWKQRFRVTEGVLRAEREKFRASEQGFQQKLLDLQNQLRDSQAAQPAPSDLNLLDYFSQAQIDEYGEDQCKVMATAAQKAAAKIVQTEVAAATKPLHDRQQAEAAHSVEDAKRAFQRAMIKEVPDYLDIDKTDGWLAWLSQEDPSTGLERQEILNKHVGALDAKRVSKLFKDYLSEAKPPVRSPMVAPHGSGASAADTGTTQQVASAQSLGPPTAQEIRDYKKRAALGKITDSDRKAFEARWSQMSAR